MKIFIKNNQFRSLPKLKPANLLAHNKQSFRYFLTKQIQDAFFFINRLTNNSFYDLNFVFLSKYIYFQEISYFNFVKTHTYGYHIYIPVLITSTIYEQKQKQDIILENNDNEEDNISYAHIEWFYCGLLPSMTQNSSFIIKGITRSIFTQLIRKQGLFFHQIRKNDSESQKLAVNAIMELRIKKINDYSSKFLFYRKYNGYSYIIYRDWELQIPGSILLKALNLSSNMLYHLFETQKFKITTRENKNISNKKKSFSNLLDIIPTSALEARYIIYILFLLSTLPNEYIELYSHVTEKIDLLSFISQFFNDIDSENKYILAHSILKDASEFFLTFFWSDDLRECDTELREQLSKQCNSPYSSNISKLQALDFFAIFRRLFFISKERRDIDHLINKDMRSSGDFLFNHTLDGLQSFFKTLEEENIRQLVDEEDEENSYKNNDFLNQYFNVDEDKYLDQEEPIFNSDENYNKENPYYDYDNEEYISDYKLSQKNQQKYKLKIPKTVLSFSTLLHFRLAHHMSTEWKKFFTSGTLSQYGQNLNPLSFLTHSRRFTSLGDKGLEREHASVDVRNIHTTSFGHLCPIETPEGKNVGLIHSLALFTWCKKTLKQKESDNRFILNEFATPFYYVYKNQIQKDHPLFVTLQGQEQNVLTNSTIAADIHHNKWFYLYNYDSGASNYIPNISVNFSFENELYQDTNLQYFSPYQIISAVTSLIPFVEHDDANRALMGSNMQRQAVNLLNSRVSKVKTGLEVRALSDINHNIYSPKTGYLAKQSKNGFILYTKELEKCHILFNPHKKSNEDTYSLGQITNKKNWIQRSDFYGEYGSSKKGKLALGQNLFIGYLPWYGWNYEDAIILNEKCIPLFTGLEYVNIEFDPILESRVTLDPIEKKDLMNQGEGVFFEVPVDSENYFFILKKYQLSHFLGTFSDLTFNIKNKNKKFFNSKLYPGQWIKKRDCIYGKCVIRLSFTRSLLSQYLDLEDLLCERFPTFQKFKIYAETFLFFKEGMQKLEKKRKKQKFYMHKNTLFSLFLKRKINYNKILKLGKTKQRLLKNYYFLQNTSIYATKSQEGLLLSINKKFERTNTCCILDRVKMELVRKKKLEVGDKLSGRHGNKGILSKICANENMPYLLNGKSLDIVLNPLGLPSRMNLGQLYECFLGLAGHFLNESYTVSLFDEKFGLGASRNYTFSKLYESSLRNHNDWLFLPNSPGKTYLFDGVTGESFEQPISIGFTSILKLVHMVDKKLYARTTGPYSALSKQPVRGRSLQGGQRLGEMEIWALQGYGAAFTLQEVYSVKSGHFTNKERISTLFTLLSKQKKKDFNKIEYFLTFEADEFSSLAIQIKSLLINMQ
uniref:DNA-directed RNA polymerase subunit beta n=1 Tax=Prototheca stagnorum TaxID=215448 RepID=A0A2Z6BEP4_9CHLO|nr:rna polymerase beta subunit [Prototheca stagnorum]BBD20191.1 rna polymerase beta subunit [Prototheca stagnorum]